MFTTAENIEIVSAMPEEDLNHIVDIVERNNLSYFEKLGDGSYSDVYGYKGYAIKKLNPRYSFVEDSDNNDVQALKDLSHLDCIPKIYAVINEDTLIVERINGLTLRDVCERDKQMAGVVVDGRFKEQFHQSLTDIMVAGYNPDDVHEGNLMIDSVTGKPKIVDLGWFKKHGLDDYEDVEELKESVSGYSNALSWAGKAINRYLKRND